MVAAFGLGAGWEALRRAIRYSQERVQGGGPLSQKQGYTHKLLVPNAVRLEASRAYIEWVAERLDAGEDDLATEGAVAKYLATEAGNKAAEDAIQALGGYGYTREYMVEKIKRDVRITTIYEGTSEIMEWTIARDRWQLHLKSRGQYYLDWAARAEKRHAQSPNVGAGLAAMALRSLGGAPRAGAPRPPDPQPARALPARASSSPTPRRRPSSPSARRARRRRRAASSRRPSRRWRACTPARPPSRWRARACAGRSGPARPTPT